ncbi:hypothetical protein THIOSC13_470002 [uncultured Thiomicrorhabdus sp.]
MQNTVINDNNLKQQSSDVIDLLPLFQAVWYRKWTVIAFTFLVTLLAALFVSQIEPVYKATATLQIDQKKSQVVSIEELYGVDQSSEYLNTQFELIKSRAVAERVVEELNLVKHREFDPTQQKTTVI